MHLEEFLKDCPLNLAKSISYNIVYLLGNSSPIYNNWEDIYKGLELDKNPDLWEWEGINNELGLMVESVFEYINDL